MSVVFQEDLFESLRTVFSKNKAARRIDALGQRATGRGLVPRCGSAGQPKSANWKNIRLLGANRLIENEGHVVHQYAELSARPNLTGFWKRASLGILAPRSLAFQAAVGSQSINVHYVVEVDVVGGQIRSNAIHGVAHADVFIPGRHRQIDRAIEAGQVSIREPNSLFLRLGFDRDDQASHSPV